MINSKDKVQVIDQFGTIAYSSKFEEIGTRVDNSLFKSIYSRSKDGTIEKKMIDGKQMYISSFTSSYSKWTAVRYIDIHENLSDLIHMQRSILTIGGAGILASLVFIYFYSYTLSLPIRHLASRLANIKRGKLIPYRGNMKSREVAVLYSSYNAMIEDLDKTIKDLSYRQVRESEARLLALKAQFQPHFLYNTLNTIYFYAVKEKQNILSRMVLSLSELLRYSIQPGSEFVRLRDDLEQLNRFIELQHYRYEDKLNVEIEVEEELFDYPVMKLLLQPIVENAITHGLEKMKNKQWLIRIQIVKMDNRLCFTIEDNGKGMSVNEMKTALEFQSIPDTEKTMQSGVGLPNLQHRIKLIYGEPYGLELSASALGGLKVQLEIPIRTEERAGKFDAENYAGGR
ncbi:sensor histidine kinase [Paenibacillus macerans]|uniref:sensor histidine kinase n=1 Tax=Paenibacillus macerans TaxID=44252 RepID=UPI00203D2EF4|nr:histidine kinase [Paenibacillus macerans]MCM3699699.1 histidine kinase [Paenibacillus macerans]